MTFDTKYRMTHDVLGKGSFGEVKRCVDKENGENYAVKIIRTENMRVSLFAFDLSIK